MTLKKSKKVTDVQSDIIVENQKVYLKKYPDFPLFEKEMYPQKLWRILQINLDSVCDKISEDIDQITVQLSLLDSEFAKLNTPLERSNLLKMRAEDDRYVIEKFDELTDPNYKPPEGEETERTEEARRLHLYIKYVIGQLDPIDEFYENRNRMFLCALEKHGIRLCLHTGEIETMY